MVHKDADVLAIVAATRPAQTAERIHNALNSKRARAGLSRVSLSTVRSSLNRLHKSYNVVRLTGDDAAACGAFPHQYAAATAFWIAAEHYRSYHPDADLPPLATTTPRSPAAEADTAPHAAEHHHTPPRDTAHSSIHAATLSGLDQLRRHVQADITTLARLDNRSAAEDQLAARLVTLLHHLGTARWAFLGDGTDGDEVQGTPPANGVVMPKFSARS